uniref:SFRICE_036433 n=1 Tax=Spodoptera frugiperda TaxID=7108 RepID=A0A2H1WDG7_SPOFR
MPARVKKSTPNRVLTFLPGNTRNWHLTRRPTIITSVSAESKFLHPCVPSARRTKRLVSVNRTPELTNIRCKSGLAMVCVAPVSTTATPLRPATLMFTIG